MGLVFQDSGSPFLSYLSFLNDHVTMIMLIVVVFIIYMMVVLLFMNFYHKNFSENTLVESIWSVIPSFLLIILILPSMQILYMMEDVKSPALTFKVIAHQWYWSYVYPLWGNFFFNANGKVHTFNEVDSVMDLSSSFPRLLGSSVGLYVPVSITSRLLISSSDVIHSFAVPSMALKVDAVPGRINQIFFNPLRCGVFFGQCSEICGSNHSFMPILVKVVGESYFSKIMVSHLLNDVLCLEHVKL